MFDALVHVDFAQVKLEGQCHRMKMFFFSAAVARYEVSCTWCVFGF